MIHPILTTARAVSLLLAALAFSTPSHAKYEASDPIESPQITEVFSPGKGGVRSFHSPSLIRAREGVLLALCEGRKAAGAEGAIFLSRSEDGGKTWDAPRPLAAGPDKAPVAGVAPCAVFDEKGATLWLAFARAGSLLITSTGDAGKTWGPPREIVPQPSSPGRAAIVPCPGAGIQLRVAPRAGRLILPCIARESRDGKEIEIATLLYSDDRGQTWKTGAACPPGIADPGLAEMPDGTLLLTAGDPSAIARSSDGGLTFQWPSPAPARSGPGTPVAIAPYDLKERLDRDLLLLVGPAGAKPEADLVARLSYDGGRSWEITKPLGAGAGGASCIAPLPDGRVACLFERGAGGIALARFNLHWLEVLDARDLPPGGIRLFDGRSLGRWVKADFGGQERNVLVKDGAIQLQMGEEMTGIAWGGPLPRMDYVIDLEAMRVEGSDFFCGLTFPVGSDPCTLVVGGWGGSVVGLSCLDYLDAANNETCQTKSFDDKRWYRVRVRVTEGRIQAWIDDDQLIDVSTEGRKIGIRFEVEPCRPLGVATWCTSGALRNIVVRPAKGDPW